jgi:hypothetical protein
MTRARVSWVGMIVFVSCATVLQGAEIRLLPATTVRLEGPRARQRFLVEAWDGKTWIGDLTREARFSVDDPRTARVSPDGVVEPLGNGPVTLTAKVSDQIATAAISVEDFDLDSPWSFRNHVEAVLTRHGCNAGACHGAAAGKNGLRLSLRGYAPEQDYDVLTRQSLGRRIAPTAPAESLLLLKPTGALAHGGGVRFTTDSRDYRLIAEWIAAGMTAPADIDATVRSLTAYPRSVLLAPGQVQQVIVQALYSDGRSDDVTGWARFASTDESVARVDESGRVTVVGRGEAAITVGFASAVDRVTVTSPRDPKPDPRVYASAPRRNPIDEKNLAKLESLGIAPSADAGDAAFLRRASLDATGTLPSAAAVEAFLKDPSPSKRTVLVDRLLASPEYVDYWSYRWSDLFLVSSSKLSPRAMWSFYRFLRRSVQENRPWDRFARDLLTARGSSDSSGAAAYFALHRDPIDLAESASMAFLGLSLTCARCHNHPLEKWTQDQYYGFASLFSRVGLKDGVSAGEVIVTAAPEGEIVHPRRGVAMPPAPLDGSPVPAGWRGDRREAFADWLARPENPYFAKAIVNRVWSNFFGRGLIHPEDDLRMTNPPSDEALLNWLTAEFVAHHYDIRQLIRTIMTSATYARSSVPAPGSESDVKFLSHYPVKRLSAEVLLDAASQVTGVPTPMAGYPANWRSLQLPDNKVESTFLDAFGRPARASTCSCERSSEPSMSQALHLANGATINEKLRSESGTVAREAAAGKGDPEVIDHLFLSALARHPSKAERARMGEALKESAGAAGEPKDRAAARRQAVEDLYWAVLTSKEFLFNH